MSISTATKPSLDSLISSYSEQNRNSSKIFQRAGQVFPGGNSRTGVYINPFPVYVARASGVYMTDVDGNQRLDFINNASALILGHAHPAVVQAVQNQVEDGTAYFAPSPLEVELAELLQKRIPSLERVRFCSSGTEAVLNALRAARAFTGRTKVAKFEGAYHGIDDAAMISYLPPLGPEIGPKSRPVGVESSGGLSSGTLDQVLVLPFNDLEACSTLIRENSDDLAALVIDPLSTAAGMALPVPGFLEGLRQLTSEHGIVLIFDEVVSFRASSGGAQKSFGICPDLTCLAKVIAGGTPGGAFGGREDIMSLYDPQGHGPVIPQSGTYNGNPVVMTVGLTTLGTMTDKNYDVIHRRTKRLSVALQEAFKEEGVAGTVVSIGSLFQFYFLPEAPKNYREACQDNSKLQRWLYFYLMNRGIVTRRGGNVSLPMDDSHVERLIDSVRSALRDLPSTVR